MDLATQVQVGAVDIGSGSSSSGSGGSISITVGLVLNNATKMEEKRSSLIYLCDYA